MNQNLKGIAKKELAITNKKTRIEWRSEAPPLDSGVLCPKQNLLCYKKQAIALISDRLLN